jgi:hypothetical protein
MGSSVETASVTVTALNVTAMPNGGRAMATASVATNIEGIGFRIIGIRLVGQRDQRVTVELRQIRDSLGRPRLCIEFPEEILVGIEWVVTRGVVATVREGSAALCP